MKLRDMTTGGTHLRHLKTARALSAVLTLGAFASLPALAQDATPAAPPAAPATPPAAPPAPANGPGPATQPPPAPGTALPAPTQPAPVAPAAAPTPPPNYGLQYNGLFDGYYLLQFHNPKDAETITGRVYDVRNDSPTLALGELNVFENPRPNSLGFKLTLDVGDNANINVNQPANNSSNRGEARFKALGQAYGTYALGGSGAGVDFGKFFTPFGYEVSESNANYNYSRSLAYTLVPFYHFGARIYSAPGVLHLAGLTATGYITRGLYNTQTSGVQGGNPQPGIIGQLNYAAPSGKFTFITSDGFGKDRQTGSPAFKSTLSDNDFTYNFNASTLAGAEYVYLSQTYDGSPNITVNGYAFYFRRQFSAKDAYALRVSGYETRGGGGPDARPYELTATYEIKAAANFLTRFEYRHDNANSKGAQVYLGGSDTSSGYSNQDTVSASEVFTF
jgi:hypothetical protein